MGQSKLESIKGTRTGGFKGHEPFQPRRTVAMERKGTIWVCHFSKVPRCSLLLFGTLASFGAFAVSKAPDDWSSNISMCCWLICGHLYGRIPLFNRSLNMFALRQSFVCVFLAPSTIWTKQIKAAWRCSLLSRWDPNPQTLVPLRISYRAGSGSLNSSQRPADLLLGGYSRLTLNQKDLWLRVEEALVTFNRRETVSFRFPFKRIQTRSTFQPGAFLCGEAARKPMETTLQFFPLRHIHTRTHTCASVFLICV